MNQTTHFMKEKFVKEKTKYKQELNVEENECTVSNQPFQAHFPQPKSNFFFEKEKVKTRSLFGKKGGNIWFNEEQQKKRKERRKKKRNRNRVEISKQKGFFIFSAGMTEHPTSGIIPIGSVD